MLSLVIFGPSVQVESSNPTLPKTADDHPAEPLVRYGAMWKARFTSGSAPVELHHSQGHDPRRYIYGVRKVWRSRGERATHRTLHRGAADW